MPMNVIMSRIVKHIGKEAFAFLTAKVQAAIEDGHLKVKDVQLALT